MGAGVVIGGVGEGVGAGSGTGSAGVVGCAGGGVGTNGAVGLDGGSTVSAAVGVLDVAGGPLGSLDSGGTRSIGGAGVLGAGGSGRDGSDGPIAVDSPRCGRKDGSARCDVVVEHATPNALAVTSEPTIAVMVDRGFMMIATGCEACAANHGARRRTLARGTRIALLATMPARAIDSAIHLIHEGCGEPARISRASARGSKRAHR